MKATRFAILTAIGLVLSFLAAGCHMNPQNPQAIPNRPPDTNGDLTGLGPIPGENPNGTNNMIPLPPPGMHDGWTANTDQFKDQTIHFAFDSSVVRSADKSKIAEVANYL